MLRMKKLTKREIILVVLLIVIIAYYFGVQLPVSKMQEPLDARQAEIESQIEVADDQLLRMQTMSKELKALRAEGGAVATPMYDNANNIIMEMDTILGATKNYSLTFGDEAVEGNILRRTIDLRFATTSYEKALDKINDIENSDNSYLVNELSLARDGSGAGTTDGNDTVTWTVTMRMTSFEIL